ncbi:MAG: hypothetical protein JOZ69_19815 [Myxococcales bacterium]|nr:hypothetical protein [Myxococcales bacterium]
MSERRHRDLWTRLADEASEDEIDRAASVSVEQAEAELRAAGFDVAAERARANAFLEGLESGAPRSSPGVTPQPTRSSPAVTSQPTSRASRNPDEKRFARRRPAVAWLAAAATLGGIAGAGITLSVPLAGPLRPPPEAPSVSTPVASPQALAAAADLRRRAMTACAAKQWARCLADLDKARATDPGGDDAPEVRSLRDQAIEGIGHSQEGPPR